MTSTAPSESTIAARPDRPWLMLCLTLASLVVLGLSTLLLPHDPLIRYQQLDGTLQFRAIRTYQRIALDQTPIDIAIIGNSRLESGVSAPALHDELSRRLGRPVRVANLSLPQEGRNAHYAVAKELFAHHPEVRFVLLSAIEAMPREGHPAFRNIAEPADVLGAPVLINRSYLEDLAFVPFRQMSLFVQSLAPQAFGVGEGAGSPYTGPNYDTTTSYVSPTGGFIDKDRSPPAEELRGPARDRVASITPAILPASLASREYAIEHHYTKAIADMARANGSAIGFIYLPIFENREPLRQEAFYRDLGPVFAADCVADKAGTFSDYGHLNHAGALALSRMLGAVLAEQLSNGKQSGEPQTSSRVSVCK